MSPLIAPRGSPRFDPLDREALAATLGLAKFPFTYFEIAGDLILRALRSEGGTTRPVLEPWSLPVAEIGVRGTAGAPVLAICRPGYRLPIRQPGDPRELAAQILPYPIGALVAEAGSDALVASPKGLSSSLRRFRGVMAALERRLAATEVGCLWIEGGDREFALMTHHVGRKLVQVGQLDPKSLCAPAAASSESARNPVLESLGRVFRIAVSRQESLTGQLDHLTLVLQAELGDPGTRETPRPGPPELGL
jgi:hypothetical protein